MERAAQSRTFHRLDAWRSPFLRGLDRMSGKKRGLGKRRDFTRWATCRRCWERVLPVHCANSFHWQGQFLFAHIRQVSQHLHFTADRLNWSICPRWCPQRNKARAQFISTDPNPRLSPPATPLPGAPGQQTYGDLRGTEVGHHRVNLS